MVVGIWSETMIFNLGTHYPVIWEKCCAGSLIMLCIILTGVHAVAVSSFKCVKRTFIFICLVCFEVIEQAVSHAHGSTLHSPQHPGQDLNPRSTVTIDFFKNQYECSYGKKKKNLSSWDTCQRSVDSVSTQTLCELNTNLLIFTWQVVRLICWMQHRGRDLKF